MASPTPKSVRNGEINNKGDDNNQVDDGDDGSQDESIDHGELKHIDAAIATATNAYTSLQQQ